MRLETNSHSDSECSNSGVGVATTASYKVLPVSDSPPPAPCPFPPTAMVYSMRGLGKCQQTILILLITRMIYIISLTRFIYLYSRLELIFLFTLFNLQQSLTSNIFTVSIFHLFSLFYFIFVAFLHCKLLMNFCAIYYFTQFIVLVSIAAQIYCK